MAEGTLSTDWKVGLKVCPKGSDARLKQWNYVGQLAFSGGWAGVSDSEESTVCLRSVRFSTRTNCRRTEGAIVPRPLYINKTKMHDQSCCYCYSFFIQFYISIFKYLIKNFIYYSKYLKWIYNLLNDWSLKFQFC